MISKWRHILTRGTNRSRTNRTSRFRSKHQSLTTATKSFHSSHSSPTFPERALIGGEKTVETVISAGSTLAETEDSGAGEEPMSLMQHVARMGRRGSRDEYGRAGGTAGNGITVRKEVYIKEEQRSLEGEGIKEEGEDIV
jgi:hypothetical protein